MRTPRSRAPSPSPHCASSCSRTWSPAAPALRWRIDLAAIAEALPDLTGFPSTGVRTVYKGPTLFLRGERSDYLTERHETRIHALFPAARIVTIAGAGHWLHAEQPAAVVAQIERFLDEHGAVS